MAIQLIYELDLPPGRLAEVSEIFNDSYLPGAARRGMAFVGCYITPPVEIDDAPTTLVYQWSLADAPAVWAMKRAARGDDIRAFWDRIDSIVVARRRRFLMPY